MSADCKHQSILHRGELVCRLCRWVYRIGLDGSRWVDPKVEPID